MTNGEINYHIGQKAKVVLAPSEWDMEQLEGKEFTIVGLNQKCNMVVIENDRGEKVKVPAKYLELI